MKDGLFMSVASYDNLNLAWKSILSKESAGGIDNITLDSFGRNLHNNLESLHRDLIEGGMGSTTLSECEHTKEG